MKPSAFAHQVEDTAAILEKPAYALFNEPGTGKSRTVVDAVTQFRREHRLDQVIIVCPAAVRSVWADPNPVLGEFAKWAGDDLPYTLTEYTRRMALPHLNSGLSVVVTNPEFIRQNVRLEPLQKWAKQGKTLLVVDESWAYKTPDAQQTKAMQRLRACCGRVVILNGTPGEPHDQYAQFAILDRGILDRLNHAAFKAHYCVMGGYQNYQIVGYRNMDEFHARTAPYCVVRKLRECVDMGPEPIRTQIDATLTPKTWRLYTELRDELIAWLSEHEHIATLQAGVRVLRLAQMVNGFVGGVRTVGPLQVSFLGDELEAETEGEKVQVSPDLADSGVPGSPSPSPLREVGREKLDALIEYLKTSWSYGKLLVFTRFRADVERTAKELRDAFPGVAVARIYGAQAPAERELAKLLLAPDGDERPAIVVANAASGGAGLNLTAASLCVFLANDYSYRIRRQAEGRVDRIGQKKRVTFLDILAVGPEGQRTVDHHIVSALRKKEAMETWTVSQWRALLEAS